MKIRNNIYHFFFGEDSDAVWRQFSLENSGTVITGHFGNQDSVEIIYRNHKIIFDRYIHYQSVGGQSHDRQFTRIRLEYRTSDDLRFGLTNQRFMESIGKLFGAQDIQIGDKEFDKKFMIKGNDEHKIKTLFSDQNIIDLILEQDSLQLEILDKEGIFGEPIQDGHVLLYLISEKQVKEVVQLDLLLKLFRALVDQLTKTISMKSIEAFS